MDKDYLPIRDAAAATGYSVEYVRQLARAGAIKTQKLSQTFYLVYVPDLAAHRASKQKDGVIETTQ